MNFSFVNSIILQAIHQHEGTRLKRRPLLSPDPAETIDRLFKLVRTGTRSGERFTVKDCNAYICLQARSSMESKAGVVQYAYTSARQQHARTHPPSHHAVDSTYAKNAFGRVGLRRNPLMSFLYACSFLSSRGFSSLRHRTRQRMPHVETFWINN